MRNKVYDKPAKGKQTKDKKRRLKQHNEMGIW